MIIREVTPSDIPSLAKLAQKTYADTFGLTMSIEELLDALKTRSEDYFRSVMGKDTILVAEDGDTVIGFIQFGQVTYDSIQTTKNDIELHKIYVETSYQGKGIGKKLMETMFTHNRLINIENVYLDVFEKNEKAIRLYEAFGFQVIGKIPFKVKEEILGYDLLMKRKNTVQPSKSQ